MNAYAHEWTASQPKAVLGCDTRGQCYVHGKDRTIACTLSGSPDEQHGIALLLAAAPELLHELRLLNVDENGEQKRNTPAWRAIAKATGVRP